MRGLAGLSAGRPASTLFPQLSRSQDAAEGDGQMDMAAVSPVPRVSIIDPGKKKKIETGATIMIQSAATQRSGRWRGVSTPPPPPPPAIAIYLHGHPAPWSLCQMEVAVAVRGEGRGSVVVCLSVARPMLMDSRRSPG
ncbi:unnamed protein product [Pleuronectes platessa]|uniref:Uncharacterized protein n=1 Tax=Pleuronectes platessa TaxID=8262 RepID=A0A9N7V461_PLEPL|nr:unnamed protein product [Pleuronectes platessa]